MTLIFSEKHAAAGNSCSVGAKGDFQIFTKNLTSNKICRSLPTTYLHIYHFLVSRQTFKVYILKGHKSLRLREIYSNFVAFSQMINLGSNKVGRFIQIFTAFSEYMFFSKINTLWCQINESTRLAFQIFPYPPCTFSTQLD